MKLRFLTTVFACWLLASKNYYKLIPSLCTSFLVETMMASHICPDLLSDTRKPGFVRTSTNEEGVQTTNQSADWHNYKYPLVFRFSWVGCSWQTGTALSWSIEPEISHGSCSIGSLPAESLQWGHECCREESHGRGRPAVPELCS